MNETEFIKSEIAVWGEDYVFDLIDRGYTPVQLVINGSLRWWWKLSTYDRSGPLTQTNVCATLAPSRSVVSPVSTEMLTRAN